MTLYSYDGEDKEPSDFAILDASSLFDGVNIESQDSGFEYASVTEIDIKEHCIDQAEDSPTMHRLHFPDPAKTGRPPPKSSGRDPRLRQVSLASPTSLYGRAETPMADPQNIAQGCSEAHPFRDHLRKDVSFPSDREDRLVIDVDNE